MSDEKEIYDILNDLGLDEDEINGIGRRNKLLSETTAGEVKDIVDFFKIKCKIDEDDIARIIIKNPFILSESFARIDILSEMYANIGFSEEEYKKYIVNFDKAFSLNPKELADSISGLTEKGKNMNEIKQLMIESSYQIF